MQSATYLARRGQLETYFDRTAAEAWKRLTSDAPVSGIRATVRAGRDRMRATLMSWLPDDLRGKRVLDAGCGTGALAVEAARRGAHVVAIDLAGSLVSLAGERLDKMGTDHIGGHIDWRVGDMTDPALGAFDHVVGMDSLIHYRATDMARVVAGLAARSTGSVLFTFAPRTPLLSVMHAMGRAFPKRDRAPSIEPVRASTIGRLLRDDPTMAAWQPARTLRIASGFYTSQALELIRS
jgi:magnesium-protoporphyrin O-methyltransferase